MTTSVVTGGAGFLGSHLCEYLLEKSHRVICLDNTDGAAVDVPLRSASRSRSPHPEARCST